MRLCRFSLRFYTFLCTSFLSIACLLLSQFGVSPIPQWAEQANVFCIKLLHASNQSTCDYQRETQTFETSTLGYHPKMGKLLSGILITDDPNHIFESSPPSSLDYAVILDHLAEQGCQDVVIATRVTWDASSLSKQGETSVNEDEIGLGESGDLSAFDESALNIQALNYKLTSFQSAVIGFPVTRGAVNHTLPPSLARALIDDTQFHGNISLLPQVNQVPLPPSISGAETTLAGFSLIENAPADEQHIPLIARWTGEPSHGVIPSLELLTIMRAHRVLPSEITIEAGKFIKLGKRGPVIPIDTYGQTSTPTSSQTEKVRKDIPKPIKMTAENLIARHKKGHLAQSSQRFNDTLCVLYATGEKSSHINLLPSGRIDQLRTLSAVLPVPGKIQQHKQLLLVWQIALSLCLSFVISLLITLPAKFRHLGFSLSFVLLIVNLRVLMAWQHQWFGLLVPGTILLVSWIVSTQLKSVIERES